MGAGVTTVTAIGSKPNQPPSPEPPTPVENPSQTGALDLMTAELADLVELPGVGTARAKRIQELVETDLLNLDMLQSEIPEVSWVELYNQGQVTWPGGLDAAPEETVEETPQRNKQWR